MPIPLGKILASESHLLYHARIYDTSECDAPPSRADFAFGAFVAITPPVQLSADEASSASTEMVVGLIANSRLLNPDSGHYGPQLTIPQQDNALFAPDYLNELGILVSVLLLGQLGASHGEQGVPPLVLPVGSEVRTLSPEEQRRFHRDPQGRFQMRYFPLLAEIGPGLSAALFSSVCTQLAPLCDAREGRLLEMMRKNLAWQSTLGTLR